MATLDWINALAQLATFVGVIAVILQLRQSQEQSKTDFEDTVGREYREIASKIPTKALLGRELNDQEIDDYLDELYRYIDLSNEQVFLRKQNRIRPGTWENWRQGIESNFRRPAFKKAWEKIKVESDRDFSELRRLEAENFRGDPRKWR
jgi:hypothetical protein